jgi:hypothetical protein
MGLRAPRPGAIVSQTLLALEVATRSDQAAGCRLVQAEAYPSDRAGVFQLAPEAGSQLDPAEANLLGQAVDRHLIGIDRSAWVPTRYVLIPNKSLALVAVHEQSPGGVRV